MVTTLNQGCWIVTLVVDSRVEHMFVVSNELVLLHFFITILHVSIIYVMLRYFLN